MAMTKEARAARREQVERLLSERERDGLSLTQLARRSGIPYSTLAGWVTRLRRERLKLEARAAQKPAPFVEFVAPARMSNTLADVCFEVVLRNERRLLIGGSFEELALTRLVRALEAC